MAIPSKLLEDTVYRELHPGWNGLTREEKEAFVKECLYVLSDAFVTHWIRTTGDIRKDFYDFIKYSQDLALSPEVSKEARALIDRGRAEAFLEILGDTHGKS